MKYAATYDGENLTIFYTAWAVDSYNPDFVDIVDIGVDCIEILGVDVSLESLPDKLQSVIWELSKDCEFEPQY